MARAKTAALPGVENGKVIKEISDAAEAYEKIRDRRMDLTEKENEANGLLVTLMKKHKLKIYKDDDNFEPALMVDLTVKDPTERAKVRRDKKEKEE